jgi:hypothetical protein
MHVCSHTHISSGSGAFIRKNKVLRIPIYIYILTHTHTHTHIYIHTHISSGSGAFIRKNKVLESLAKSVKGAAAGPDLDSDPAFFNEVSPDSSKVCVLNNK